MKKVILILLLLLISFPASASMSKLYLGDENGQFIFGIEAMTANNDGALGGEIRTYLAKNGIVVNGVEYGSLPGRTLYNIHIAGKNQNTVLRYDHNTFVNHNAVNDEKPSYVNNSISLKAGTSSYLFYE